jgi:hypothetical protein
MIDTILTAILLLVVGITIGTVAYVSYLVYNIIKEEFLVNLDNDDV